MKLCSTKFYDSHFCFLITHVFILIRFFFFIKAASICIGEIENNKSSIEIASEIGKQNHNFNTNRYYPGYSKQI